MRRTWPSRSNKGCIGQKSSRPYATQCLTSAFAVSFVVYAEWIEPMGTPRFYFAITLLIVAVSFTGCRGRQHAIVLNDDDEDMIGSHEAGAETWKPLIDESVAKLLGRACHDVHTVSYTTETGTPVRKVCFVGVENRSSEPIGDFRDQIYEHVDSLVGQSDQFRMISRRYVEAAMAECRCRPDLLVLPDKQRELQAALERQDQPFDYLLFAQITSGTTQSNKNYQRDYLLTLELLDIHSGESLKESASLRKGYSKSKIGMFKQYGRRK